MLASSSRDTIAKPLDFKAEKTFYTGKTGKTSHGGRFCYFI